jgi:hypothetical protein
MTPNTSGVWEWFDSKGTRRLMEVHDCETNFNYPQHLRVKFNNGFYNVREQPLSIPFDKAEWPDNWGCRVGDLGAVHPAELYLYPTFGDQLQFSFSSSGQDVTC